MSLSLEDHKMIADLLQQIASNLERSANSQAATHELYKKANQDTKRHMEAREEREREQNERAREDFAMARERHESFMRDKKMQEKYQRKFLEKGGKDGNIISSVPK